MLRSSSDPTQFPSQPPQSIQGVPPLTGDGLQFDARLDHSDSDRLLAPEQPRVPSGGRVLAVAAGVMIGLLTGFAGGFLVGQRTQVPAPRFAAQAAAPAAARQPQSYTDSAVAETVPPSTNSEVGQATAPHRAGAAGTPPAGLPGRPDKVGPTSVTSGPGSLQIASRPAGAQVFVDEARVGTTPMTLPDVSAGAHRVRIEMPGFRRWATSVDVASGERVRVGASLER